MEGAGLRHSLRDLANHKDMRAAVDAFGLPPPRAIHPLHADAHETVTLEMWEPDARTEMEIPRGAELFVLSGDCIESCDALRPLSWLRIPVGGFLDAVAGEHGALVWIKTGGLRP